MNGKQHISDRASRRSFFLKGLLTGVAVLFGLGGVKAASEKEETVTLITADGKLVEVPKKALPGSPGAKVSNVELLKWKLKNQQSPDNL